MIISKDEENTFDTFKTRNRKGISQPIKGRLQKNKTNQNKNSK